MTHKPSGCSSTQLSCLALYKLISMTRIPAVAFLLLVSSFNTVHSQCGEVCFDGLECFSNCPPWDIFPLPNGPERIGTQFRLYTRPADGTFTVITETDLGPFVARHTVFVTHGFTGNGDLPFIQDMVVELLNYADMNVVVIDWRVGSQPDPDRPIQPVPASNTRVVGRQTRNLLTAMTSRGMQLEDVHCVGHSLGSHLCGFLAKEFTAPKIARISALDPAGQLFDTDNSMVRLDQSDAEYVDAIHTNARGLGASGIDRNVGDSDFWPHRGGSQPGCAGGVCDHFRGNSLFVESINSPCDFNARPCFNYNDMMTVGGCDSRACAGDSCGRLGYHSQTRNLRGTFYLETQSANPFCLPCCSP